MEHFQWSCGKCIQNSMGLEVNEKCRSGVSFEAWTLKQQKGGRHYIGGMQGGGSFVCLL